jgi:ABC-type amino acid transport system permease subunit
MKDSLKNNDCFYFVNKHIQLLYYQLFSFVLCVVFVIFVFLNSLENPQQRGIQLVKVIIMTSVVTYLEFD